MESKKDTRKRVLEIRNRITDKEWKEKSCSICEKVVTHPFFLNADTVYCYVDYHHEVATKTIIEEVCLFCKENKIKIEVVVNDWGIIKLFDMKNEYFDFNLGILLNKRKKDPRMVYKNLSDNK